MDPSHPSLTAFELVHRWEAIHDNDLRLGIVVMFSCTLLILVIMIGYIAFSYDRDLNAPVKTESRRESQGSMSDSGYISRRWCLQFLWSRFSTSIGEYVNPVNSCCTEHLLETRSLSNGWLLNIDVYDRSNTNMYLKPSWYCELHMLHSLSALCCISNLYILFEIDFTCK